MYYIYMEFDLKNNFVLLSKVAKEKKYAQEYLGLLARRGDLGSVRIGKRWFTTPEWFSEFVKDAQKRKEEVKVAATNELEIAGAPAAQAAVENKSEKTVEDLVAVPLKLPNFEKVQKMETDLPAQETIPVSVIAKEIKPTITPDVRNTYSSIDQKVPIKNKSAEPSRILKPAMDIRRKPAEHFQSLPATVPLSNKKDPASSPAKQIEYNISRQNFSPNFPEKAKVFSFSWPKFALVAFPVLLLAVLAVGTYLYRQDARGFDLWEGGKVAGAEDSKLVDVVSIKDATIGYLEQNQAKSKENISFSRLAVETALEKAGGSPTSGNVR